jgi:hypothetical protein
MRPDAPIPALYHKVEKLMEPSFKLLGIVHESFTAGKQSEFWGRVWSKASTKEPFVLATRTVQWSYEKWKDGPPEAEPKA